MKNVLVIGSINMDLVINTPRVPMLGETVIGSGFSVVPGGKGQNQAVAASRLGCNVKMVGAVGEDVYGKMLVDNLASNHVNTSGVQTSKTSSGIAIITVCKGDNHIIINSGANKNVDEKTVAGNVELIKWADVVVLQFELPIDTIYYAAKLAKEHKKTVLLNPAPMIDFDRELLKYVDIFIPNQYEAGQLLGRDICSVGDGMNAVQDLLNLGIKQVVITLGADGCVYNVNNAIKHQPAYKNILVVDTTSAGDSFVGGICKGLCEGYTIDRSIAYATAVSALTVSKKGASISIPFEDDVEEFMKAHSKRIILASASPRRSQLLKDYGVEFEVLPPNVSEDVEEKLPPEEFASVISERKARACERILRDRGGSLKNVIIIAADTIVAVDEVILGKPRDEADAFSMLKILEGRCHSVHTGFTIAYCEDGKMVYSSDVCTTKVKFKPLSHSDILEYINTGEPLGKAGSYAIQGKGSALVESVEGDYNNVVGLPIEKLFENLDRLFH